MRARLFAILCSSLLYIAGCAGGMSSSGNSNQTTLPAMPAVALSSSSSSINAGSSVTLNWTSSNASSISITPAIAPAGAVLPLNGSATVTPSSTTTYAAIANGSGGSAQAQVKVIVNAAPPQQPQISFSVTPSTIEVGASATLQWSTRNASMVTIGGLGQQPPQGSLTVSPTIAQTYTATAWNGSLSQTASVTVNVQNTQSVVAVNMAGPDNYYFTPSPLADSLSLYGINPSTGALTYLAGSQASELFNNAGAPAMFTSADGHWLFVQEADEDTFEFSLTDPANFAASQQQVEGTNVALIGADPTSNWLLFFYPNGNDSAVLTELVDVYGGFAADGALWGVPASQANEPAIFDSTGRYFVLGPQLYAFDPISGGVTPIATSGPAPDSRTIIAFDHGNAHILAHTMQPASSGGYQDQISIYNFNANNGAITFNNSKTIIPGRGGDFNVFGFSNNILWVLSQGVMTTYAFDPAKATLKPTGNQFNISEDFQIPFAIDSVTNTLIQPAAQANQLNSYVVDQTNGNSRSANGPYQAGTAPWTLAIAHVQ
jgi:hypothetical protein